VGVCLWCVCGYVLCVFVCVCLCVCLYLCDARIVLGAVAPTPIRAFAAEGILTGNRLSDELIERAASQAGQDLTPISDVRASRAYRERMTEVLVRRALRATRDELERNASSD